MRPALLYTESIFRSFKTSRTRIKEELASCSEPKQTIRSPGPESPVRDEPSSALIHVKGVCLELAKTRRTHPLPSML